MMLILTPTYLLYGVGHVGVYEPEEQVPQGPALDTQHHGTGAPSMGQGQVDGQQLHGQQNELMVVPEIQEQTALWLYTLQYII